MKRRAPSSAKKAASLKRPASVEAYHERELGAELQPFVLYFFLSSASGGCVCFPDFWLQVLIDMGVSGCTGTNVRVLVDIQLFLPFSLFPRSIFQAEAAPSWHVVGPCEAGQQLKYCGADDFPPLSLAHSQKKCAARVQHAAIAFGFNGR